MSSSSSLRSRPGSVISLLSSTEFCDGFGEDEDGGGGGHEAAGVAGAGQGSSASAGHHLRVA
jgi:hypothetical protein